MNSNQTTVFDSPNDSANQDREFDILGQIALGQRAFAWNDQGMVRSEAHDHLITKVHEVGKELVAASEPQFFLNVDRRGQHFVDATALGRRLWEIASASLDYVLEEHPLQSFSPAFMTFLSLQRRLPCDVVSMLKIPRDKEIAEKLLSGVLRVVDGLRRRLGSATMKRRGENFRRGAIDRFNGTIDSIDWLAEREPEVVVLRFDLHFRKAGSMPARFGDEPDIEVLDEFLAYRERFQRSMNHRFGDALVGYAWTLEYGRERNFHLHYLVFLTPAGHEDHAAVVDQLAAKWVAMTGDCGEVYNCNRHPWRYKYSALGTVRLDDPTVITGLHYIVTYITLAGLYVKLDVREGLHTFGKGRFPKEPLPRVGRPAGREAKSRIKITVEDARTAYLKFL